MRMTATVLVIAGLVLSQAAGAELKTRDVSYKADGTELKGYIAYDDKFKGERPGVLVVHEWWGLNDYARKRARMLAELGYIAMAVDMYGNGKTAEHPDKAGEFSRQVRQHMDEAEARFLAAKKILVDDPLSDDKKIAAIGYCFGGGIVLEMARRGVDLDGVVSFHGSLPTNHPAKKGEVKAKVLVLNGADDPFTKPEAIANFKQEMENAGVDYKFINYEGAKHSFTNPGADAYGKKFGLPLAYNAKADKASWKAMQAFFDKIFGKN
jgi:dienelactone hydrolase